MGDNFQRLTKIDRSGYSARCYNTNHKGCNGLTKQPGGHIKPCTCGCHGGS